MLRDTHAAEIDALLARYASRRSAVLPLLYIAQDEYGSLTNEAIREVAATLDLPYTDVFEVVGFYTLYYNRPMGKFVLQVCDDVPCCYLGAEELVEGIKERLGIVEEQTSADGIFTLQRVKCLASCDKAPVVQANLDYLYNVTVDTIDDVLRDLRARAESGESLSVSGRLAEDYDAVPGQGLRLIERNLGPIEAAESSASEPAKAAEQEAASAPEEPAQAEAEQKIAEESPVPPDTTVEPPEDAKQGEHGAQPANQMPQDDPPKPSESVDETRNESARGWRQQVPEKSDESSESAAAEQPPAEDPPGERREDEAN